MPRDNGHANNHSLNIGDWLSAKIYSDMKSGCSCGCKTWDMEPLSRDLPDYEAPICSKCSKRPELFVIVATIKDADGKVDRIKIRHTQDNIRLTDIVDVIFTLRTVSREIKTQSFDARKYEAKTSRESYKFDVFAAEYIAYFEKKLLIGEITPGGLKDKKTLIKNHLLPYFKDIDIGYISDVHITKFFDAYTDRLRMRDRATAELKTMLRHAKSANGGKKIKFVPEFPEISPAEMITPDKFIDENKQDLVLSKIEHQVCWGAITTLKIYGLRPCDVRALKWEDLDCDKGVFYVRSHMSLGKDIKGRKSQKSAVHELPIMPEFEEVLSKMRENLPRVIRANDYIFKSIRGGAIAGNTLTRAWNDACKIAKVKGVKMYWGTKHSTLSRIGQRATDAKLIKLSGHTNTKTIRRYNQSNVQEIRELLK